jgi:3-phenylpropionate/trans-cinnamate dioxygenase ferredoxin reductase subunit
MSSDPSSTSIVIVGAGQAGGEVAVELRKLGYPGHVTVLGDEAFVPYRRPPLSKAYLAGTATLESLYVMPPASLAKANVEHRGNVRVERVDRAQKRVLLEDGEEIAYDKLALCTGGRARMLTLHGAGRRNVFPLRSIADVDAIRPLCAAGKRVAIIGGGFIGLEVAAVLRKLGLHVTVLESLPRVLARVTVPEVSSFYEALHRGHGVDLRTDVQIESLEGEPEVQQIVLKDGARIDVDFIVFGIGVVPNVELAQGAGLTCDNGIVVDECARTSDPEIVAAGDCTSHPSDFYARRVRLESVQNAMDQARCAAATLLGKPAAYRVVPWFWSDQYDLKLQMVGLSAGFDRMVMRGDPAARAFAAFYLKDGALIAADTVGRPQDFMFAKKLVAARVQVTPEQLADEGVALKSLLPA